MFPISIAQIKIINFIKFHRLIIWTILRDFQLKNDVVFESVYLISKNKITIDNYLNLKFAESPDYKTLIIFEDFNYKLFFKYIRFIKNMRITDKKFFLTSEASTRFRLLFYDLSTKSKKQEYYSLSHKNFQAFSKNFISENIAILGTGPSFDEGKKQFISRSLNTFTCNSAIYDDDIWATNKFVLCFADPVFHFGLSNEAKRFKKEVINKFNKYKFYVVVPIEAFPLLINEWKIDKNYLIGLIPKNGDVKYPLIDSDLVTKRTSNIMTEFMLPVASKVSKNIELAGFDGRKKNEKNFWQYSEKTFQTIDEHKLVHPSFFNDRNIDKYYRNHLKILSKQIELLEDNTYIVSNKTPSNITCLQERTNV